MKKILEVLLSVVVTFGIIFNPIQGLSYEFTAEHRNTRDAFDQGGDPFDYRHNFSLMDICIYPDENMTYQERLKTEYLDTVDYMFQLFNIGIIDSDTDEYKNVKQTYGLDYDYLKIYRKNEIHDTFNAYYGTDIDVLALPYLYEGDWICRTEICGDYFVFYYATINIETDAQWRKGYRLGDADYWIWALKDPYGKIKSPDIHTIVKKETVHGYTFPAIKYIGFTPPSDELIDFTINSKDNIKSDWETGMFKEIMRVGDCIYYEGNFRDENGVNQRDGLHALCVYNTKTREDKTIIPREHDLQMIGNKLWAVSGVSSGSWSRELYCFDFNGDNIKFITSGYDVCTTIGDRIYIGYDKDMDYCGVISCDLNGEDIRTEVEAVYAPSRSIELHNGYAVVGGKIYTYTNKTDAIKVQINNKNIAFDNPPIILDDRTFVPMRKIFEELGAVVIWDGATQKITAVNDAGITIKITIGEKHLYVNDEKKSLENPAQLIGGTTYIPLRVVAEAFNAEVLWDGDTHTVSVNYDKVLNKQEESLIDFLNNRFEKKPITMQTDNYTNILIDDSVADIMQKCDSSKFIDIDNDGMNELVVISTPLDDNIYGKCISVWDCDEKGNVISLLAKGGQTSRVAYRYFIIKYNDKIYLLESAGETTSAGCTKIRNLYTFNNNKIELSTTSEYNSFSDIYLIDNEDYSAEYVEKYILNMDESSEFLFRQFELQ